MKKSAQPRTRKSKILSPQALARVLARSRKGKRIVFTNGCYDILHAGHVTLLENSRKLGDVLVVALNTDASVKKIKGPSRPINGLKDRLQVMAAVEAVDYVTWFAGDTPLKEILQLHPDVLVKGGDWKVPQIVGAREVLDWGGKVYSLKLVPGRSTTRIIEKSQRG